MKLIVLLLAMFIGFLFALKDALSGLNYQTNANKPAYEQAAPVKGNYTMTAPAHKAALKSKV